MPPHICDAAGGPHSTGRCACNTRHPSKLAHSLRLRRVRYNSMFGTTRHAGAICSKCGNSRGKRAEFGEKCGRPTPAKQQSPEDWAVKRAGCPTAGPRSGRWTSWPAVKATGWPNSTFLVSHWLAHACPLRIVASRSLPVAFKLCCHPLCHPLHRMRLHTAHGFVELCHWSYIC